MCVDLHGTFAITVAELKAESERDQILAESDSTSYLMSARTSSTSPAALSLSLTHTHTGALSPSVYFTSVVFCFFVGMTEVLHATNFSFPHRHPVVASPLCGQFVAFFGFLVSSSGNPGAGCRRGVCGRSCDSACRFELFAGAGLLFALLFLG